MPVIQASNRALTDERPRLLGELASGFGAQLGPVRSPSAPLAIVSGCALDLFAAAVWLAQSENDGLLLPAERLTPRICAHLLDRGYRVLDRPQNAITEPAVAAPAQAGRISLLTSGTAGAPKLIEHSWTSLFTMSKARNLKPLNWLVTYQPGSYAWYQLVTLALFVPGQTLTLAAERNPLTLIESARRHGVTAISATPTFWRIALLQLPRKTLRELRLQQITLGGERVDQVILDELRFLFPAASIAHIYASTEAGACIVVRDGREGFPAAWLRRRLGDSVSIEVRDGMLWVCSSHASVQHTGFFNSGDAVEVRGDRVIILGRADRSIINVAGMKVVACDIERQLLEHPGVHWCRVYGRRAPITGELVAADIVRRAGTQEVAEAELAQFCAARLADYMVPRFWRFMEAVPATDNLKSELA